MTMNLLAMLLSLALALTGAPTDGALFEPIGRVVTVENIVLTHNEDEVALTPRTVFGVSTDGKQAVYDFYIDLGGDHLLPFQAVADADGVFVLNDTTGTTLRISAEELETLAQKAQEYGRVSVNLEGMEDMDPEAQKLMTILKDDLLPAYQQMLLTLMDKSQAEAFQAQADALADEMIDRGEGEPGAIEYEGEEIPATVYRYALDGAKLGAICDAVLASNPATKAYADAYFKLIAAMPQGAEGLEMFEGVTNYETLMAAIDMTLDVTESVAESGLTEMKGTLTVGMPGQDQTIAMNLYSLEDGDYKTAEVTCAQEIDGIPFEMQVESTQEGEDVYFSMTFSLIDPESRIESADAAAVAAKPDPALIDEMVAEILADITDADDTVSAIDKAAMRVEGSGLPADEVIQAVVDALNLEGVTIERAKLVDGKTIADVTVTVEGEDSGAAFYIMENAEDAADAADAADPAVDAAVQAILDGITDEDTLITILEKALARADADELPAEAVLEGVLNAMGLGDAEADDSNVMFYCSMNGFSEAGEAEGDTNYGFSFAVAQEEVAMNAGFGFGGTCHGDGTSENYVFASCNVSDDFYGFSCDVNVENTPIASRVDPEKVKSLSELEIAPVAAGLTVDSLRLVTDKSVKDAMKLFNSPRKAAEPEPVEPVEPDEPAEPEPAEPAAPALAVEPVMPSPDGTGAREAEPFDDGAVSFGVPQFSWLPDGYRIDAIDVDTQYDTVDYTISNPDTGDEIYVFFSASYYNGAVTQYLVGDGAVVAINSEAQSVITEENDGDFRRFTLDDGKIAINVYPYSNSLADLDIAKIIAGVNY